VTYRNATSSGIVYFRWLAACFVVGLPIAYYFIGPPLLGSPYAMLKLERTFEQIFEKDVGRSIFCGLWLLLDCGLAWRIVTGTVQSGEAEVD
jgi:hypothetical protein